MDKKTKIMIIDDNKEFVKLLAMFLNSQTDMEVVATANDGKNAVNIINTTKPDILLLDIIMPEKDGLSILEDIVKDEKNERPTTIVMSAIGQEKVTQKAISLGATYYVVKPFDMATLTERLRDLVEEQQIGNISNPICYKNVKMNNSKLQDQIVEDYTNVLNKLKLFAIVFSLNISCFIKTPSRMAIFALQELTNQSKYLRKQLKADV